MPLVPTGSIVAGAHAAGTGAAAFNVIHLETAEALVAAADATGIPLILQISENCVRYHGSLLPLTRATLALAEAARADVSVHLDHITDPDLIRQGVAAGVGSVMIDASTLPYAQNVETTARLTAWCHEREVFVEAELGEVGGKDGVHAPGVRTDPDEALAFVAATGVDALAVAVGSSHAMRERTAKLDLELIRTLRDKLPVPLVLHGSSGVPDDELRAAIEAGMTKINISTHLVSVFTGGVRKVLEADPALIDSRKYVAPAREAVRSEAARLLDLLGGAGREKEKTSGEAP
ncbi:class II fructose-bisphosphate aldolase [Streptomyces albus]|uniref:Fructose-bisphosphate aldolase n=1 Tax=Streptomyces albus TaxID=1888 RepID=A0A6C1CAG9_9ACTN|nr:MULTISPECIES: class II fructose-bisphosphate aldolase [Streptomyces]KPC95157.1 fructose-bisphosphate aldolase [Streptomyces sp. NRRL F-6602]EPD92936.1 ketose-bisphosphate aldolase [Streptomyces sp. HPH0547]MDI6408931.1 class II fructose-bisphosphate aldolase family protein [Streptomyces albus]QID39061.1 class II fructose-bisphosphate aldolase family protein [Streptomyces albus]TGG85565.1 fructose-bisphosphate aldolase [Streptomyces albus]